MKTAFLDFFLDYSMIKNGESRERDIKDMSTEVLEVNIDFFY